jgi:hypothetical protein
MEPWRPISEKAPPFECLFTLEEVDATSWAEQVAEYATVDKVYRIFNPILANMHQLQIVGMQGAYNLVDVNITTCYYAMNPENAVNICQNGLTSNLVSDNFHRADWECWKNKIRVMFQCSVALGKIHEFDDIGNICPPGYTSTVNIVSTGYNISIRERHQACIEYIILYKPNDGIFHSPNLQIMDKPVIVYIPASVRKLFNDMIEHAGFVSPEAQLTMKGNISLLVKGRKTPEEFLADAEEIFYNAAPPEILDLIKYGLARMSLFNNDAKENE